MLYNDESNDLAVGSGHTPGFGFLFPVAQVQSYIATGQLFVNPDLTGIRHVNDLGGSVGFLSEPDSRRLGSAMRARDLEDEWYARDACPSPEITGFPQGDLFEIKCKAGDNYSSILNRLPDRNKSMPTANSLVVASCLYETISAGKFKGQELRSCRRVVVLDGFILDYQIQKENVPLYQQLDAFLRGKIADWKKNCSTGRGTQ